MENHSAEDEWEDVDIPSDLDVQLEARDERPGTPDELIQAADDASQDLLPSKSKTRYDQVFNNYQQWKEAKGTTSNSERVIMSYFFELSQKCSPPTLWARFSMLKSTLKIHNGVDISTYGSLTAFLKKKSKGYVPKKARILTEDELQTFIGTAPDVAWLDVKVACIFAICGACRRHELPNIAMTDIARYDDMYYVTSNDRKTGKPNGFAITGSLLDRVRSYQKLRPSNMQNGRFFLNFQSGKCTSQPIGKNKFYKMPRRIAQFLKLPDPDRYTGHSFRRSSTTLYANTGATIEALKRHTGHSSTKVCEAYIDDSLGYKRQRGDTITAALQCSSTSENAHIVHRCATSSMSPVLHLQKSSSKTRISSTATSASTPMQSYCFSGDASFVPPVPLQHIAVPEMFSNTRVHSTSMRTDSSVGPTTNVPEMDSVDDCDTHGNGVVSSQTLESNEISSQNFVAQLNKHFGFYKCDNLTINFNHKNN